jgi:hypothetical protein
MRSEELEYELPSQSETDPVASLSVNMPEAVRLVLAEGGSFNGDQPCYPGERERQSVITSRKVYWPELFELVSPSE